MAVNALYAKTIPVEFRIELRDRNFNILEVLDNQVDSLSFTYARLGGCGSFSFNLPRAYCDEKFISGGCNVRIYIWDDVTQFFDLWYQGYVQTKTPSIQGGQEMVNVAGQGYQGQLSNIQLNNITYVNQELSVIVADIVQNHIAPNTGIVYNPALIQPTAFVGSTINFSTDCGSALQTLEEIAGNFEYGVDVNRNFYFIPQSTISAIFFSLGANVQNFSEQQDFTKIINQVVFQGGTPDGATVPYTNTFDDTLSQLKYGIQSEIIQSSSITDDQVAQQYANSIFEDFDEVVRSATCDYCGRKERLEAVLPIPLTVIIADSAILYGQQEYGTFLYSGLIPRQINQVTYNIDSQKGLSVNLQLGTLLPNNADFLNRLQYQVEQLRIANL